MGYDNNIGLPTGGELAEMLSEEVNFPGKDKKDFLQVTQYYAMARNPHLLRKSIREKLTITDAEPSAVHNALASMPFRYILTTNYDNMMERSLKESAGKYPKTALYERRMNRDDSVHGTEREPVVYKLHGTIEQLHTMIVTEDDIIDFAACVMLQTPPLPASIRMLFSVYSFIFVGYGLKDWNIRVMLRALRGERQSASAMDDYAIQRRPEDEDQAKIWDLSVMHWHRSEGLRCYDLNAVEFVEELRLRYENGEGTI